MKHTHTSSSYQKRNHLGELLNLKKENPITKTKKRVLESSCFRRDTLRSYK